LNSWVNPNPLPPHLAHNQHVFLVPNFPNLAILVGKRIENSANSKKNVNNKNFQKFEITNLKEKRLFLVSKVLKIILIILKNLSSIFENTVNLIQFFVKI